MRARSTSMSMILVVLPAVLLISGGTAAQSRRPLSFVDIVEMPLISEPQPSPDGRRIAFVLHRADWNANRTIGQIVVVNADGTGQTPLTFGEHGASMPRWSPDGRQLAFSARRGADTTSQIYLLDFDGGEPRRLTSHPTSPGALTWAPDGKALYFTATDVKSAEERERERLQHDVYPFEENFKHRHLWVADLAGKTTRLTGGDFSLRAFSLSQDGTRIVMVRAPTPLLEHSAQSELWIMRADGSEPRRLTDNGVAEHTASLSPDNTTVAFLTAANERFESYHNDKIFLVPAAGGTPRALMPDAPYEVESVQWALDGRRLYFTANLGVHNELMTVDVGSGRARALTGDDHHLTNWTYAGGLHVFTRNTPLRPSEIFTLPADGGDEPRRVTDVFGYIEREFTVARQQRLTWTGQDGQIVEGLLYYPVDYVPGRRYPLIVYTHGGPQQSDKFGFSSDAQVYAGKGYAVLKPNYRGSTGYGDAFLRDMVGGYFKQSHLDVMAGVDAVIAMGLADPDKLVKMGWSAGGHMTNKLITFTDRFKAASSGAGAANWISMYAQSDTRVDRAAWFGGTPWQADAPIDTYWAQSPLKDAWKAKTPTLFLVGEQDARVPLPQSVEMYRALKAAGVPTRLWVAPREGHGWSELRHRLFKFQVEMEWFERHVHGRAYTWEAVPGEASSTGAPSSSGTPAEAGREAVRGRGRGAF